MNKIITINLGGRSIQIEEDAYDELRAYLLLLEKQFVNTENGEDIIEDIEARISEMLFDKLKNGKSSVNKSDILEVIGIMGKPSDLDEDSPEEEKTYQKTYTNNTEKRLFRDPDHQLIGGVCSGLSQYFGMDVTLVRIIWLLLFFVFGTGFLIYIILWVVVPKANTTAEKLQMKGEMPNIENIKRTVAEEAQKAMHSVNEYAKSAKVRGGIQEVTHAGAKFFRLLFTILAGIISFVSLILIIAVAIYLLFGIGSFHINGESFTMSELPKIYASSSTFLMVKILVNLIIVLPLISLVLRLTDFIFNVNRSVPKYVYQTLGIAWLLALAGVVVMGIYTVKDFKEQHNNYQEIALQTSGDTLQIEAIDGQEGILSVFNQRTVTFKIEPASTGEKLLRIRKSAKGSDEESAAARTQTLTPMYTFENNKLEISNRLNLKGDIYRGQHITYILKIPTGTIIRLHPNTDGMINHETGLMDLFPHEAAGHVFEVTSGGLKCLDCFHAETGETKQHSTFNMVRTSGAINVKIRQSDQESIRINGSDGFKDNVKYEVVDGELMIELKSDWKYNGITNGNDNEIIVSVKDLKRVYSEGAGDIEIKDFETSLLDVELKGVSMLYLNNVKTEITKLEIDGGGKVKASGKCDKLALDMSGTAMVEAFDYVCNDISLNAAGASKCEVHALNEINGELDGIARVNYKGNPEIKTRNNGAVKISKAD